MKKSTRERGGEVRSTRTEAGRLLNRGLRRGLLCHVHVDEEVWGDDKRCVCVTVLVCYPLCVFISADLLGMSVCIL